MALPIINLSITNSIYGIPESGTLLYEYAPFYNLLNPSATVPEKSLLPLRLDADVAKVNIDHPIAITTEVSYDDSVNIIVTDDVNPPKIINSRFYLTSSTEYKIADRHGNLDTNIYSADNFKIEASLIKNTNKITTIDFLGIKDGGNMKVGNYTFYFKLADYDGNESDFIAESGKVICHIGTVNSPKSIRGGQLDENSNKVIKFRLNNLDLAYDYINIYYTRSTGDGDSEIVKTYFIEDKFKIVNNNTEISITGYENHTEITTDSINIKYANFDSVKTLATCQNICFAGNITNNYEVFKTLEKYSLYAIPTPMYDTNGIGYLDENYNERYPFIGNEYFNANNIYYKLGYWDEEVYRLGIVYIMNDYTLSPVFNIRGKKVINENTIYSYLPKIGDDINYGDDYLIEGTDENVKGVFKIDMTEKSMMNGTLSIKPIGLKVSFQNDELGNSVLEGSDIIDGLKDITKGFFIVRQKRIPTILAQAVGISTSTKAYTPTLKIVNNNYKEDINDAHFGQSFLTTTNSPTNNSGKPKLGTSLFKVDDINHNALLCPEATLKVNTFNSFFNSSEFLLRTTKYTRSNKSFINNSKDYLNLILENTIPKVSDVTEINTPITLIEPGIELIKNSKFSFSSQAGNDIDVSKYADPKYGAYEDLENTVTDDNVNYTSTKVRGIFNTYLATESDAIVDGEYYNIFQKDYNFNVSWKDYFKIRYNNSSPFFPITDRIEWSKLSGTDSKYINNIFRGDCYINTVTQRMTWNFTDGEVPTNKKIIDPWTWYKNFRVINKASTIVKSGGTDGTLTTESLSYRKLLPVFTYRGNFVASFSGETSDGEPGNNSIIEADGKKFKKYSEINGLFGSQKINKPDVNAVPLGYWVTIKVCSNTNLAMRDVDFSNPMEEAVHKKKRGFYPYHSIDMQDSLPESHIINGGISKSLGDKNYFEIPDVPFIKTSFTNRINYSNKLQQSSFVNGTRIFESPNYQDYTLEHGELVKLEEWYGTLIAVMEHGVLMIPVNERAMMTNAQGDNVYINTDTVLPKNPKVLSNTFGSMWADSIIKTSKFIYGIDTVAKKIWRTNGQQFEVISDLKIQKFLNDHINLKESDYDNSINVNFVKSHYNAFKQDVMFVFKYNNVSWHLCHSELTNKWVTQYTWFPEFSENINNIFYTFANTEKHENASNYLYKHGFAGFEEEQGTILPTYWYDAQYPFEFEFVANGIPGVQKIFNNLKIISNLAEPNSFYYEVVGEGFDWNKDKDLILKLNNITINNVNGVNLTGITDLDERYRLYLIAKPLTPKLPYIITQKDSNSNSEYFDINLPNSFYGNLIRTKDISIKEHNKTKEKLVNSYQQGLNLKQFGRVKGNMQYMEDSWDIQIQPINFTYAYVKNNELLFTKANEMKIRDKYIKIRVKYDGTQYAVINALRTLFTISYA